MPISKPRQLFFVILLLIAICFVGCRPGDAYSFDPTPYLPKYDSFYREDEFTRNRNDTSNLGRDKLGRITKQDLLLKKMERAAGLDFLDSGYADLQIRILYSITLDDRVQNFILKRHKGKWNAIINIWKYGFGKNDNAEIPHFISAKVYEVYPESDWETVFKKLNELGIFSLPDEDNLDQQRPSPNDGDGYSVEIATKNMYRNYGYSNPSSLDDVWQIKKFLEIMKLLHNEFGFEELERILPEM